MPKALGSLGQNHGKPWAKSMVTLHIIAYTFYHDNVFIALVCIIFAEDKAALGNLKTCFHCARLHNLCIINKYIELWL